MLPVVLSLKQHPDARKLVPPALWKYFDEPVLVSGWYPERDYWVLISTLVSTFNASSVGGDVWRYFAKFSAQRDIGGQEVKGAPPDDKGVGIYRMFAPEGADPEDFFRRATRLWSQYHDTGRMEVVGGRVAANSVIVRLSGFSIPIEGFVRLQGYYMEEYGRLAGLEMTSHVRRSTANRDSVCEWEVVLGRTPVTEAYVAGLLPAIDRDSP